MGYRIWENEGRSFLIYSCSTQGHSIYHHLEVGPFYPKFILSSIPGPFLRDDEELGHYREAVDLLKSKVVKFICIIFQVQYDSAYTLGIDDTPNVIVVCTISLL